MWSLKTVQVPTWFGGGLLGLWVLESLCWTVTTSDSSGSASLGLMRCHGHVASCIPARHHVAWCGPTRPTWCLLHNSLIWAPMYANDISISIISTSPLQWCRLIWHLWLFMMIPYMCHWFTCSQLYHSMCILMCPATKDRNPKTCGNCHFVSINPYSSVDDHFSFILSRNWQPKSGT
jgi:hypothetical protein